MPLNQSLEFIATQIWIELNWNWIATQIWNELNCIEFIATYYQAYSGENEHWTWIGG